MDVLAALPWHRLDLGNEEWLLIKFARNEASYSIAMTDAKSNVWLEHVPISEAAAKANLSNVEAQPAQIFEKIETFLWKAIEKQDASCTLAWEPPELKLSADMVLFVFRWTFHLTSSHPNSTYPIFDYVTKPFMDVAVAQSSCIAKLIELVKKKDNEILELRRLLPSEPSNAKYKTDPFDLSALDPWFSDTDISKALSSEYFQRAFKSVSQHYVSLPEIQEEKQTDLKPPEEASRPLQTANDVAAKKVQPIEQVIEHDVVENPTEELSAPSQEPQPETAAPDHSQPPAAPPSLKVYEADASKKKKKRKLI